MKILKRMASLLLCGALALGLTACQEPEAGPSDTPGVSDAVNNMTTAVAGLPADTVMVTVNGQEVTAEYYLYWLAYDCTYWTSFMSQYGVELDWDQTSENGVSNADFLRQDAVDLVSYYLVVEQKAEEESCGITGEQEETFQADLADYIEEMGGQTVYQAQLDGYGITDATFQRINRFSYLYSNLMDKLVPAPSEEELADYIEANQYYSVKHILLLTIDATTRESLDEETIAGKRALADDLLTQLNAADDLAATFDELMQEYSEDTGLASNPDGYVAQPGDMVTEFEEASLALEVGEMSAVVESSYGYHIILRQEIPQEDLEELEETYRTEQMQTLVDGWVEGAQVTTSPELDSLDTETFYNNYTQYQETGSVTPGGEDGEEEDSSDDPLES